MKIPEGLDLESWINEPLVVDMPKADTDFSFLQQVEEGGWTAGGGYGTSSGNGSAGGSTSPVSFRP